jgi:hypothetical protein
MNFDTEQAGHGQGAPLPRPYIVVEHGGQGRAVIYAASSPSSAVRAAGAEYGEHRRFVAREIPVLYVGQALRSKFPGNGWLEFCTDVEALIANALARFPAVALRDDRGWSDVWTHPRLACME